MKYVHYDPLIAKKMQTNEIDYYLSRCVPDMDRGFSILTTYGEIDIPAEYAKYFIDLTNIVLLKQRDSVQGKTA